MTFSEKLITLRAGRGWSQERLAEELGVTRQAVGRWEKGAGLPDAVGLTRLAAVFDVAPEWLLDEAAPDKPERAAAAARGLSGSIIWRLRFLYWARRRGIPRSPG